MKEDIKKLNVIAIFSIILFAIAISPVTLQNDTFYTIAIGEHILENGIDMQDPFSYHENLEYTYPHWLYDVCINLIYQAGGMTGIYISTIVLAALLGLAIYFTHCKISKNNLVSFVLTIGVMWLIKDFIAARAQLVTFILFVLTIYFIEYFLKTKKKRYAIGLIIIPILIANVHLAVWPFYFVLYIPYIVEYIVVALIDCNLIDRFLKSYCVLKVKLLRNKKGKEEKLINAEKKLQRFDNKLKEIIESREKRRENPYKIKVEKNDNVRWLIIIMVLCIFTGFLTPLGDTPFTYLVKTMQGSTTNSISEHQPLVLINSKEILCVVAMFLAILIFTDTKIKLRDLFMISGLILLMFMQRRQQSMFFLIGLIILNKLISALFDKYDKNGVQEFTKLIVSTFGAIITFIIVIAISLGVFVQKKGDEYVSKSSYPIEASEYILNNIDVKNMKIYNEYNYGSYLLYKGIPVFIDSRADLYAPEFNSNIYVFDNSIQTSGIDIYYEEVFDKYNITHVILYKSARLNIFISRDNNYNKLYEDDNFVFYERLNVNKEGS